MRFLVVTLLSILFFSCAEKGCTDPNALNYSIIANKDDGSCEYCESIEEVHLDQTDFKMYYYDYAAYSTQLSDSVILVGDLQITSYFKSDESCFEHNEVKATISGTIRNNIDNRLRFYDNPLIIQFIGQLDGEVTNQSIYVYFNSDLEVGQEFIIEKEYLFDFPKLGTYDSIFFEIPYCYIDF